MVGNPGIQRRVNPPFFPGEPATLFVSKISKCVGGGLEVDNVLGQVMICV